MTTLSQIFELIEMRITQVSCELAALENEADWLRRNGNTVSPALEAQIARVREKQENFHTSLELWRTVRKEYPNYDRG